MAKRDYLCEIVAKRSRLATGKTRFDQIMNRFDKLRRIRTLLREPRGVKGLVRPELAKYLPIGNVACIEGFFRLLFRDLVDHGSPFRENVAQIKDMRISLDQVVGVHGRVSLGEFVSHLLPLSSFDDINSTMSTILNLSFLDRLKATPIFEEKGRQVTLSEAPEGATFFQDIQRVFELRHIFCHEPTSGIRVDVKEICKVTFSAFRLVLTTENMARLLLGNIPIIV